MSAAARVYRLMLRAYPPRFRAEYGREMELLFRDQRRGEDGRGLGFWGRTLWDVARSAPALRIEAFRGGGTGDIQPLGGTMKAMATVAILIGVLEVLNAGAEGWAGGLRNGDAVSLVAGVVGILAGALLVAAGAALLRRSPRATKLAGAWAVVCVAMFACLTLFVHRLSIAASAFGIAVPVALLIYLWRSGGRRPSPTVAAMLLLALTHLAR